MKTEYDEQIRQLACDIATFENISYERALRKMALEESKGGDLRSLWVGDIKSARALGVIK